MSEANCEPEWEELAERSVNERYLILRKHRAGAYLSVVALDKNGTQELVLEDKAAVEAYFHPAITPGLETPTPELTKWDVALDELNDLDEEGKAWALSGLSRWHSQYPEPGVLSALVHKQNQSTSSQTKAA